MEKDSDYLVRNPKLITEYLTSIYKNKCILTAHFGEHNASFLTAILELDAKNMTMKIDAAPSEILNKQLLNAVKVLFRTQIDGIKVSFRGKGIKRSLSDGHPAFEMPLPSSIFWMQRRQFFRVKVPMFHSGSYCEITTCRDDEDLPDGNKKALFRIVDLSVSGFAFMNSDPNYAALFTSDMSFTSCKLHLNDGPDSSVSFVIKSVAEMKVGPTATEQRVGCLFTDISPVFESNIQRYMQTIERQQKNIGGD